jgi:hypothetical protein
VFTDFVIWSTVENGLGLIASSIATLRPLFKSFFETTSRRRSGTITRARRQQQQQSSKRRTTSPEAFHCRGLDEEDDIGREEMAISDATPRYDSGVSMVPRAYILVAKVNESGDLETDMISRPMSYAVEDDGADRWRMSSTQNKPLSVKRVTW